MTNSLQSLGFFLVSSVATCVANYNISCDANQTYCASTNSCISSVEDRDNGSYLTYLQPCEHVVTQGTVCATWYDVCSILANDPANFSSMIDLINRERCHGDNQSFCPLTSKCHDLAEPCGVTTEYMGMYNMSCTPWKTNCSFPDYYYCPLLTMCVHNNISCSYEVLYNWTFSGDMNTGPYGTACNSNETYCYANGNCIAENDTCAIMLSGSLDGICQEGEEFCDTRLQCVNGSSYNTSCVPLTTPLDFSSSYDNGKGWLPFCQMASFTCPRVFDAVSLCYPLVENCTDLLETYCPPTNSSISSVEDHDNGSCPTYLQPCEHVVTQGTVCATWYDVCSILANDPANFSSMINLINIERCHGDNQSFCPLTSKCHDLAEPCGVTTEYMGMYNMSRTPWGTNCSFPDYYYCPLLTMCVHNNISCSYEVLYNWTFSGDMNTGPYGTACNSNETYCYANGSCIAENDTCTIMLSGSLDGICQEGEEFCDTRLQCVNGSSYNTSCVPLTTPLDFSSSYDDGTGWLPFCQMASFTCPRVFDAVSLCYPLVENCTDLFSSPDCPEQTKFCESNGLCIPNNDLCCPNGTYFCESNDSCISYEQLCCSGNNTYCASVGDCIPLNETCCLNGTYYCQSNDSCIPLYQPCCLVNETFCPARNECIPYEEHCCPNGLHFCQSNDSCIPLYQSCCLVNETFCPARNECIPYEEHCCPNGSRFCQSNDSCLPLHQLCCLMNETFCPARNECIPYEEDCCPNGSRFCQSNDSCIPLYQPCCLVNETFCPARNECIPYEEHCCPNGSRFCQSNDSCLPLHQLCCLMNETFCPARNECIPYEEDCCPNGSRFCQSNDSCLPLHQLCCVMNETFCPARNECIPYEEDCCPNGSRFCQSNDSCLPLHQLCCLMNETFCPARNECIPYEEDCCPNGSRFCQSNDSCLPLHQLCCLMNETFCPARNECIPYEEDCCPNGSRFCQSNDSCLPLHQPCCLMNETFCPARNQCILQTEHCCANGTYFCLSNNSCIPTHIPCCNTNETFCPARNSCVLNIEGCSPPPSNASIAVVWRFVSLGNIEGIFEGDNEAIALQSIDMFGVNGSLEVYLDSVWQTFDYLSPENAFVVSLNNYIRFTPFNMSVSHGVILVNYTAYSDTSNIGKYVNVSSMSQAPVKTFVIFEFPKKVLPRPVNNGSFFSIGEDSQGDEGFTLSSMFEDISHEVPTGNESIPERVKAKLDPDILDVYYEVLSEIQQSNPAYLFSDEDSDSSLEGKWQFRSMSGSEWLDANPASLGDSSTYIFAEDERARFNPTLNFFGNLSYEVVGALRQLINDPEALVCLDVFPLGYQQIFRVLKKKGMFPGITFDMSWPADRTPDIRLLAKAHCDLVKVYLDPTESSVRDVLQGIAEKNENVTEAAMGRAFNIFQQIYNTSLSPEGSMNVPQPPRYLSLEDMDDVGATLELLVIDSRNISFLVEVTPVNDPPDLKIVKTFLDAIPFNFTSYPGNGTLVADLLTCGVAEDPLVQDVDSACSALGLAVYNAGNSSLGIWEYKMNETCSWTRFNISDDIDTVLLPPDARIRFKLHSIDVFWSRGEALESAFMSAAIWDQADQRSPGRHLRTILEDDPQRSLSEKMLTILILRKGCDGQTDFPAKVDSCGVCRGKDACVGCDKVPFSNATNNLCGHCVGGTTGRNQTYGIDCAGQCGSANYIGPCGACQSQDPLEFFNLTDCSGICNGNATLNRCGFCVGGNTGQDLRHGEDSCGICGGDNSSCLDCEAGPNGGKVVDLCGVCLDPDDPNFDSSCVKLGSFTPVSGDVNGETVITIRGAGFRNRSSVNCRFLNSSGAEFHFNSELKASDLEVHVLLASSSLPVEVYSIECQFDGTGAWIEVENKTFTVYNRSAILLTSITPNETQISSSGSSFNATLSGSEFLDTGFLKAVLSSRDSGGEVQVQAFYDSHSEVHCLLPSREYSSFWDVGLLFGKNDQRTSSTVSFLYYEVQPQALSIQFQSNPNKLLLTLDSAARGQKEKYTCEDIFHSIQSFGTDPACVPRGSTEVIVSLGRGATINVSDYVNFTNGSLIAAFERYTKIIPGYTTLQVEPPSNPPKPVGTVFGQTEIGPCASLEILAEFSNGGGRDLTYDWYVEHNLGIQDADTIQDMEALNSSLTNETSYFVIISSEFIIPLTVPYVIVVQATNFLGESGLASLSVTRKREEVPEVKLNSAGGKIIASESLWIRAQANLAGCDNSTSAAFDFEWTVHDSSGDLVDVGSDTVVDKPYLRLRPNTLAGGENYTVTVLVAAKRDPGIRAQKAVPYEVEKSDLVLVLAGESIDVGIEDTLTLDASLSLDPDDPLDVTEQSFFLWECKLAIEGTPCFETLPDGSRIRLQLPEGKRIQKAVATFLNVGQTYTFTATMRKGQRSATKSLEVRVKSCSPPIISIEQPIDQRNRKINPRNIVSLTAKIEAIAVTATITWSVVQKDDLAFVPNLQDILDSDISYEVRGHLGRITVDSGFVVKPNSLDPGTYQFRIDVVTGTCSARSEAQIVINAPPSAGFLTVTPPSGTALETEFTFEADSFTDEDLPLVYLFSYYSTDESGEELKIPLSQANEQKRKTGIALAPGDSNNNYTLRVLVEVYDTFAAVVSVEANVTVNPVALDVASVSALGEKVDLLGENENTESLLGIIGPIVTSFGEVDNPSAEVQAQIIAVREKCIDGALLVLDAVSDDTDSKMDVFRTMGEATEGGSEMSDDTKDNFFKILKEIEGIIQPSKRRRRSVDPDSVLDLEGYSASQGETTLVSPSNLISPDVYTEAESSRKADFLALVDSVGQKMCAFLSLGFPPSVANNPLVALRADAKTFDDVDTEFTDMASTAKMLLGESLKTLFTDWSCLSTENCTWACVLSSQFSYDLLLNETSNSSLTDVVDLTFYNPETYREVEIETVSSPVSFRIPLKPNVTFPNESYVECKLWNEDNTMWTTVGCVSSQTPIVSGNTTYVECNCTRLGYITVFIGDKVPLTTPAVEATSTNQPSSSTSNTTQAPAYENGANIELTFNTNFDAAVESAGSVANLTSQMKTGMAANIGRNESELQDFRIANGSIIVKFLLLPRSGESTEDFNNLLVSLKNQITSGNFNITLPGGTVLTADPSSFKVTAVTTTTTAAPTTVTPTEDDGGLSRTSIIVIACVCSGVVLIVIIAVVVYFCMKKKAMGKISASPVPDDGHVEMAGSEQDEGQRTLMISHQGLDNQEAVV